MVVNGKENRRITRRRNEDRSETHRDGRTDGRTTRRDTTCSWVRVSSAICLQRLAERYRWDFDRPTDWASSRNVVRRFIHQSPAVRSTEEKFRTKFPLKKFPRRTKSLRTEFLLKLRTVANRGLSRLTANGPETTCRTTWRLRLAYLEPNCSRNHLLTFSGTDSTHTPSLVDPTVVCITLKLHADWLIDWLRSTSYLCWDAYQHCWP